MADEEERRAGRQRDADEDERRVRAKRAADTEAEADADADPVAAEEPAEVRHGRPLNPRRPLHRRPLPWVAVGVLVLLVIGLLVWAPWRQPTVRVTDGGDVLADYLGDVSGRIRDENRSLPDGNFVSVAFMIAIRTPADDINGQSAILHELEGAFLAQHWANHPDGTAAFATDRPLVKLLVADTGFKGTDWSETVAQLVRAVGEQHLVAVAGLGSSTTQTQAAVDELARNKIPMIGAVVTSAKLAAAGLVRVAPTDHNETDAMVNYLRGTQAWRDAADPKSYLAYLIQDKAENDTYAADLAQSYRKSFGEGDQGNDRVHVLLQDEQGLYDGSQPAAGNALSRQADTVCVIRPRVVLFAGRSQDVQTFVADLAGRRCADAPITVVTGDDVDHLNIPRPPGAGPLWVEQNSGIEVVYTALASPQTWQLDQDAVSRSTVARFATCVGCFLHYFADPKGLDDGHAIMAHDSVLTAVTAARNVVSQTNPTPPPAAALTNGLYSIDAQHAVPGASGYIYFQGSTNGQDGVPASKLVPILKLNPDGSATEQGLSSGTGTLPGPPK
ncbi:amino acid ABC transporter substrate-binding protein [Solihabitans fulvus]|uniref:Amino acid ABC transporter substrate-binding protein n=1 Tax=Solihabitans fulvus TaxID=1892852 RepID=A0A5B2XRQ2_9PSEU|nr:ABC transporter substrate-binding protein [Solihabitans fulvus]KAA2266588.1 amino acid ABC transporter substrate-binding protein [Solihabitans fulvus]